MAYLIAGRGVVKPQPLTEGLIGTTCAGSPRVLHGPVCDPSRPTGLLGSLATLAAIWLDRGSFNAGEALRP